MPTEKIIKYLREKPGDHPECIRQLFHNKYLSHITAIHVKGEEHFSPQTRKIEQVWHWVEGRACVTNGSTKCVIRVVPTTGYVFKSFDEALEAFKAEARRTGYRLYFHRDNVGAYSDQEGIQTFFRSSDSKGIRHIHVLYSHECEGFIAYAFDKEGKAVGSIKRRKDRKPFDSPSAAGTALLEVLMGRPSVSR